MTLFALAVAPNILQQAQREREKEAIFRGEEVAEAIRLLRGAKINRGSRGRSGPCQTSMDDLVEGVPRRGVTKKLRVLRASAATIHFPAGQWLMVRPRLVAVGRFSTRLNPLCRQPSAENERLTYKRMMQLLAATVMPVAAWRPAAGPVAG